MLYTRQLKLISLQGTFLDLTIVSVGDQFKKPELGSNINCAFSEVDKSVSWCTGVSYTIYAN